ncbi:hypothetical protein OS493_023439 [Desmophyllum pertusum]|uniref:Uncharacterized protein n=1 Tax=Desmophyllum pertusum TaxID=174260 RepID=A0A9W9ZMM3_9CNID|nr:hypothetical protein OS493_023439 [Desmophyllum pertusum]
MVDRQNSRPNGVITTVHVPYLTHTLRAKVHLGSTPAPLQATSSVMTDVTQQNRYEIKKRPVDIASS